MNKKAIVVEVLKGILISFVASAILSAMYIVITDNTNINFGDDSNLLFLFCPALIVLLAFAFFLRGRKMVSLGVLVGYPVFFFAVSIFFTVGCAITGACL